MLNYLRRNISLLVGVLLIASLLLFALVGRLVWDVDLASPLAAPANQPPTAEHPLGTDRQGRDLLAVMIEATPSTLYIGLLAGFIGVAIGTALALFGAYYGGGVDTAIRGVVDVGLTLPPLLILILVAISVQGGLNVSQMALVVASLSWLWPARTIRSQVLTIKERGYVQVARLSGMSGPEVIVKELLPNLLPYLGASLVGSISAAVLASIGLEVLGLGPFEAPTLGMTLYWVNYNAALINGWWWWWVPPIAVIAVLFIGLFLVAVGLDEIANPRIRNRA